MIVYKIGSVHQLSEVEAVEAERLSKESVWLARGKGYGSTNRTARHSSWHRYFDTWGEAKAFLLKRAKSAAATAATDLKSAENALTKIAKMNPPKVKKETP